MTARDAVLPRTSAAVRGHVWRELLLGLTVFGLYGLVVMLPQQGRVGPARVHGEQVFRLERALHIDVEPALNGWLVGQPVWRALANYEYAITYIVSAFGLLAWLYVRHPERYRPARNTFVLLNLGGLACFVLYPVMPPRLMHGLGFHDTVRLDRTWGSWGSPVVEHADQLAAMPSLHMAWTLWVGVELARVSARRSVQGLNAAHIVLTGYVILATANHFLLDAVAAVPLVAAAVFVAGRTARAPAERVPAADAFFLAVESPRAPQHVGGVVLLDTSEAGPRRDDLVRVVTDSLDRLPRFKQRLADPARWRRPVWRDHTAIDWAWHVGERDVGAAGMDGLRALIAEIQRESLPRDRPLWRMVLVDGAQPDRTALVFLMHHVVADGVGVVAQAMRLMEPSPEQAGTTAVPPRRRLREAAATVIGFCQLAVDVAPRARLPASGTSERRFGTVRVPLETAREVARRHDARVSDVVLCMVAGALDRVVPWPPGGSPDGARRDVRVAVPLMMRSPESEAEGNHTTAVMVDLPVGRMPEAERLACIARRSRVLRTGTRALASWFVMRQVGRLMPAPLHARFARAVYGGRFLQGVVSNLPGPDRPMRLAGAPLTEVYPIIPLAPGAPLAVGALGVDGELCFGVSVDPALVDDAGLLTAAIAEVLDELRDGDAHA
ncbi:MULTISPECIES: bifunctional phosphatase PAP2/O-acyltransferase family protein [Thermomonosporaceae]|uniref:bifunctional phosphatase PAP2/O-acyltransferase family protein n=1 Tax=Thermomonosporaceae TaxID=2012 RepID=UPI00255B39C8|nr:MULTISPECIES: phosphatase PAP2 family protein [Thermomonosporaceae]MDL4774886.1 phosphatase PAP2 family protein [Actinomadura xylanilytica]